MLKKVVIFLAVIVLFAACSKKPEVPAAQPVPVTPKYTAIDDNGRKELFEKIIKKDNESVKAVFEKGIDPNTKQDGTGYTAFVVAAKSCNAELLGFLIRKGANMNLEVNSGNSVFRSAYLNAAETGCLEVIKYILEVQKGDINMRSNAWKETALYKAAQFNHVELAKYLIEKGIDTNIKSNLEKTALDIAKEKKNTEIIMLLEKPAK